MVRSQESASTPISADGWRYQHEDEQDRQDFEHHYAAELLDLERERDYDFSDHPNYPKI